MKRVKLISLRYIKNFLRKQEEVKSLYDKEYHYIKAFVDSPAFIKTKADFIFGVMLEAHRLGAIGYKEYNELNEELDKNLMKLENYVPKYFIQEVREDEQ